MGRAVFSETDGIVSKHVNHPLFHQSSHAQGVSRIFRKHQERSAERQYSSMEAHAVHDCRHAKLANTVTDVMSGLFCIDMMASRPVGQVGSSQVRGTPNEFRQYRLQS